jgi:hypothetical protein
MGPLNYRSLDYAPPDFLWNLAALAHLMRLSFTERRTREYVQCRVAGNPGRDDKGDGGALREDWLVAERNSRSLHFAPLRSG